MNLCDYKEMNISKNSSGEFYRKYSSCYNGPDCIYNLQGKCIYQHGDEKSVKRFPCSCGGEIGSKNERNKFNQYNMYYFCTLCRKRVYLNKAKKEFLNNKSMKEIFIYLKSDFDIVISIVRLKSYLKEKGEKSTGGKIELLEKVKLIIQFINIHGEQKYLDNKKERDNFENLLKIKKKRNPTVKNVKSKKIEIKSEEKEKNKE